MITILGIRIVTRFKFILVLFAGLARVLKYL